MVAMAVMELAVVAVDYAVHQAHKQIQQATAVQV
jgi:hypothetical protein